MLSHYIQFLRLLRIAGEKLRNGGRLSCELLTVEFTGEQQRYHLHPVSYGAERQLLLGLVDYVRTYLPLDVQL